MVTSIAPILEQHMPRAQARAGGQDAHVRFDFGAYLGSSSSKISLAKQTLDQSHVAARNRAGEYCCNQQYSVTAITTSTGAISERYAYSAYGQPTIPDASGSLLNAPAISNRYTYTGRKWDATLGLHHFRARWISPIAGTFLSRDPIGFKGKSFNLYQFVRGRALSRIDPSGLTDGFAYPVTICGGGKKYEFTSFEPAHGCCTNKSIYELDTQCCESGSVVAKVSIWRCVVKNTVAHCLDYVPGTITCVFGWRFRHSYVCMDGPNKNFFSAYSDGFWGPHDPENSDMGGPGPCNEVKVCPAEKVRYATPKTPWPYNWLSQNCHHQSGNWGGGCEWFW